MPEARVVIIYKRKAIEEVLMLYLDLRLRQEGFDVFVDRNLQVGTEWQAEIERKLKSADVVLPLLSEASCDSEQILRELRIAHESFVNNGRPCVFPVRVGGDGDLPGEVGTIVNKYQFEIWYGLQDNERVVAKLMDSINRVTAKPPVSPPPHTIPTVPPVSMTAPLHQPPRKPKKGFPLGWVAAGVGATLALIVGFVVWVGMMSEAAIKENLTQAKSSLERKYKLRDALAESGDAKGMFGDYDSAARIEFTDDVGGFQGLSLSQIEDLWEADMKSGGKIVHTTRLLGVQPGGSAKGEGEEDHYTAEIEMEYRHAPLHYVMKGTETWRREGGEYVVVSAKLTPTTFDDLKKPETVVVPKDEYETSETIQEDGVWMPVVKGWTVSRSTEGEDKTITVSKDDYFIKATIGGYSSTSQLDYPQQQDTEWSTEPKKSELQYEAIRAPRTTKFDFDVGGTIEGVEWEFKRLISGKLMQTRIWYYKWKDRNYSLMMRAPDLSGMSSTDGEFRYMIKKHDVD